MINLLTYVRSVKELKTFYQAKSGITLNEFVLREVITSRWVFCNNIYLISDRPFFSSYTWDLLSFYENSVEMIKLPHIT